MTAHEIAKGWAQIALGQSTRACVLRIRDDVAADPESFVNFRTALRMLMVLPFMGNEEKEELRRWIESDFGIQVARELVETPELRGLREERLRLESQVEQLEATAATAASLEILWRQLCQEEAELRSSIERMEKRKQTLTEEREDIFRPRGNQGGAL